MIIALIVVLSLFVVFITASYFLLRKTFSTTIDGVNVMIKNSGGYLRVYENKKLVNSFYMPDLIHGTDYQVSINGKPYNLKCKSNTSGLKVKMQIFQDDKIITDNGVKL